MMQRSSGQAALIMVLIMSILGVVSVSTASRSIEGLRTQEVDNQSSAAFRAAEAGLESALESKSNVTGEIGTLGGTYTATYTTGGADGIVSENVEEGDLTQISLEGAAPALSGVTIYWNGDAAIKTSIYYGNKVTGSYDAEQFTSDPNSGRTGSNKFTGTVFTAGYTFKGKNFDNKYTVSFNMSADPEPVMLRILALYAKTTLGVEPIGGNLPDGQVTTVSSIGTIDETLKSKVTLQKFNERIPVIFDNVLYTNGSLVH